MGIFNRQEAKAYFVNDKKLTCTVCKGELFYTRNALLNTSLSTFFNLDWTDRSATCMVCASCRHIMWFLK